MIGIDSNVLIYAGLVPTKHKRNDDLSVRARLLLHMHSDDTIVLPAVAVSEILVPVVPDKRGELTAKLLSRFVCPPFDIRAASLAADLWSQHKAIPKKHRLPRQILRSDAMIIASAVAAGASKFYSHDQRCRKLAGLVLTALDLPKRDPNDIFAEGDIRRGDL